MSLVTDFCIDFCRVLIPNISETRQLDAVGKLHLPPALFPHCSRVVEPSLEGSMKQGLLCHGSLKFAVD